MKKTWSGNYEFHFYDDEYVCAQRRLCVLVLVEVFDISIVSQVDHMH